MDKKEFEELEIGDKVRVDRPDILGIVTVSDKSSPASRMTAIGDNKCRIKIEDLGIWIERYLAQPFNE